jgi:hypothetical protein
MRSFLRSGGVATLLVLLLVPQAPGQDRALKARINKAIDLGVGALRKAFGSNGLVEYARHTTGMTALAAWTLLESGVPEDDPLVEKTAALLREKAVRTTDTYDLALLLMFFDRLGYAADEPFIEGIAVRLLAGQDPAGGWTYVSKFALPAVEEQVCAYMTRCLENWKKGKKYSPRTNKDLPRETQYMLQLAVKGSPGGVTPDGSNTQFAMLALWVARRHGLPADAALVKVAKYFRRSQLPTGAWDYQLPPTPTGRITMTCSGLLALALEQGVAKKPKQPLTKDRAAVSGLKLLGQYLERSQDADMKLLLFRDFYFHYFLFSMERVAVIYDLKKIGDTDWYVWGAEKLVNTQNSTGNWQGFFGFADTCFALLFLKRANVAKDLTLNLKGIVRERDGVIAPKKDLRERERDPFAVPKVVPGDKKSKAKSSPDAGKESRRPVPARASYLVAQKCREEFLQYRFRVKTEGEVTPAQDAFDGRGSAARL